MKNSNYPGAARLSTGWSIAKVPRHGLKSPEQETASTVKHVAAFALLE